MPAQHTLHVALTEPLVRYINEQVASGRYVTASEVVRASLRLLIERDAAEARRPAPAGQIAND
ncbi:type II toxin-antitoxin system ParD family antitoxin [Roseomonas indoligenes]|uniref:Type II toxin-antitoxin system ParD family antitoxin n=1 Tax=Roseomonas indoligenes TaxID=2820811 RepID=A0A940MWM2_9PROT|nr:type II toxin-antitoxin system ParD family antitoxin [Pararoseomonas indoligenes]MBP0493416.1 type II toxin-antitoxin system ParD family antitoxin [Pararoseomonas indoligenes]